MKNHVLMRLITLVIISSTFMLNGCESLEGLFSEASSSKNHRTHSLQTTFVPPPVTKKLVDIPPPPPRIDNITASPGPEYVWMDGYWNWSDGKYVWNNGRWTPARPGQFWVAPHWKQQGSGWRLHSGYWKKIGKK